MYSTTVRISLVLLMFFVILSSFAWLEADEVDLSRVQTEQVVYRRVDGMELTMDLYLPEGEASGKKRPAVAWFHGGSWRNGSPRQFRRQSQFLASQGLVCASVRYRLSGEAPFPAGLSDAKCAVRFMRAHAAKYGVDPDRIAVGGGSAGGHLAMMVGLTPGKYEDGPYGKFSSRANLLIGFNPVFDLRQGCIVKAVQQWLDAKAPTAEQLAAISPIVHVTRDAPPTLLMHGTRDNTVPFAQAEAMRDVLARHGVAVTLFAAEGQGHGWFNRGKGFTTTLEQVTAFLWKNGFGLKSEGK